MPGILPGIFVALTGISILKKEKVLLLNNRIRFKAKNMILTCFMMIFLSGCATVKRYEYDLKYSVSEEQSSRVVIKYKKIYNSNEVDILGIAKVNKGLSMRCSESYVLNVLIKEAQSLGADIINITEDEIPNQWTNCYQADAEFLRLKDRDQVVNLKSEPWYEPEFVEQRRKTAAQRGRSSYTDGAIGGLIGGIIAAGQ